MPVRIWPASGPPPMASNASVAPVATSASVRSVMKLGLEESQTYLAPMPRSSASCSALRTMLTSSTPSALHSLTSIWPRFEAAAVCTSALWLSMRMVPTIPSAVSGLTKAAAPWAGVTPSGIGRQSAALMARYCAYVAPPRMPTVLPSNAWASGEAPASTTTPAPSLPTGMDWSTRAAAARMNRSGIFAAVTPPVRTAVVTSAGPSSRPRSEGLMGAASMRTITSSAAGSGSDIGASESSSSPLAFTSERSCRPSTAMAGSPCLSSDRLPNRRLDGVPVSIQPRDPPVTLARGRGRSPARSAAGLDALNLDAGFAHDRLGDPEALRPPAMAMFGVRAAIDGDNAGLDQELGALGAGRERGEEAGAVHRPDGVQHRVHFRVDHAWQLGFLVRQELGRIGDAVRKAVEAEADHPLALIDQHRADAALGVFGPGRDLFGESEKPVAPLGGESSHQSP